MGYYLPRRSSRWPQAFFCTAMGLGVPVVALTFAATSRPSPWNEGWIVACVVSVAAIVGATIVASVVFFRPGRRGPARRVGPDRDEARERPRRPRLRRSARAGLKVDLSGGGRWSLRVSWGRLPQRAPRRDGRGIHAGGSLRARAATRSPSISRNAGGKPRQSRGRSQIARRGSIGRWNRADTIVSAWNVAMRATVKNVGPSRRRTSRGARTRPSSAIAVSPRWATR